MSSQLYSIGQAKEILNIGQTKIYEIINSGALRAVKIGRKTLIPEKSIHDFISSLPSFSHPKEKINDGEAV